MASPLVHPFKSFRLSKAQTSCIYIVTILTPFEYVPIIPFSHTQSISVYLNLMAYSFNLFLTLFLTFSMAFLAMAGPLNSPSTLATRLKLDNQNSCWESLFELQSCSGEAIYFFLNGETYLGSNCCRAIRIIQRECWPAMMSSLGFTEQEGDILFGYCDASEEDDSTTAKILPLPSPTPIEG